MVILPSSPVFVKLSLTARMSAEFPVDKRPWPSYNRVVSIQYLIKSGGGNGPMKPRQPASGKVPIPAEAQDEESEELSEHAAGCALFVFPN